MREIVCFDGKDYSAAWSTFRREAVRAVIIKDGMIALVKSDKAKYYKFPGGGIIKGESHSDALMRETQEETGLVIKPDSIREFGLITERHKSTVYVNEIFEQLSYYYFADAEEELAETALDYYEEELGYTLEWVPFADAKAYADKVREQRDEAPVLRDAYVINLLAEREDRWQYT